MEIELNFKTSDGVTLEFSSVGEGTPIIFIAGYSGHEYSWSAQTDFLSQSGFRCLHLDKRGHGKNADAISGLRMSRLAKDIKEAEKILNNYNIKMERKPYYGIRLKGKEFNLKFIFICDIS